jgi:hypothetical protein
VAAPLVTLENTTNDPAATALQLLVASGHAPFTTNSTAKVAKLNADKLDGHDSTDFVQGGGRIVPIDVGQATGDTRPVVDLGFVRVDHFCGGPAESGQYDLTTGPLEVVEFSDNGGGNPEHQRLSAEGSFGSSFWATDPTGDRYTFSFEATGGVATAYLFSYTWNDTFLHQTGCTIQGYAVVHGA